MEITLKGNNGEKVVIPIEDLIQKYWSDENDKPNRIEMSATVKDETILAAMTIWMMVTALWWTILSTMMLSTHSMSMTLSMRRFKHAAP